jgi:hypothetical protein
MSGRGGAARGRPWEDVQTRIDDDYQRVRGGSGSLDLYFGAKGQPLLVFVHIPKTAGTALRNVIHTNLRDGGFESVPIPRFRGNQAELKAWYEDLYTSLGERAERLVCAASHSAHLLLPVLAGREVRAFTLLRDPVDRSLSRYYHFTHEKNPITSLYRRFEYAATKSGRVSRKEAELANGQSRRLLASQYETDSLPRTSDDANAGEWRSRLFELVEENYLVGIQERFTDSVRLFAREFGWQSVYDATAKINLERPSLAEVDDEIKELVRAYNWLDDELYRACSRRFHELLSRHGDVSK